MSLAEHLEAAEQLPVDREAWRIEGDRTATWVLRKLKAARAELERIDAEADEEEARIEEWRAMSKSPIEADARFFEDSLVDYYRRLEAEREMPKTYKLPAGSITKRKAPDRIEVDDAEAFKDWAEASGRLDLLRIKIDPDKNALKNLNHDEEGRIIDYGEPVPGVRWAEGEDRYGAVVE